MSEVAAVPQNDTAFVCIWNVAYWIAHPEQRAQEGITAYTKCPCTVCTKEREYEDLLKDRYYRDAINKDPFEGHDL